MEKIRVEHNPSKEKLDEMTHRQELWCNGKQAVDYGFADGFIGG